jgi:ribosome biogenesis GTPase / thiamine phosphate phosphatase
VLEGVVVEYHREYCRVALPPQGELPAREVLAKPRGRLELAFRKREQLLRAARDLERVVIQQIAIGDKVALSETEDGVCSIEAVHERETWLLRMNYSRYLNKPQCIVANADQLAVVIAPNPSIKLSVVDRYFLAAMQGGLKPLLVVNKIDLDPSLPDSVEIRNYRELGYSVFFTSARHEHGLDALLPELQDKFTVFCGHSGVGKSTILGHLAGETIAVAETSAQTHKGQHRTTTARLYQLPCGGEVVDTPGVREFVMAYLTWLDVHDYFSDIADLTTQCSFRNCGHVVEPGCAVRAAIEASNLAQGRLDSYTKLREEVEAQSRPWEST